MPTRPALRVGPAMRALIVCATARGGHIEHAADLTAALRAQGCDARLVTRVDARSYLPPACSAWVEEAFPRLESYRLGRLGSVIRLAFENVLLTGKLLRWNRPTLLVLEEPRFPLALLISRNVTTVFVVHNAQLHERRTIWSRVQGAFQDWMIRAADLCVVHGDAQAKLLRQRGARRVLSAPLPGGGLVTAPEHLSRPPELLEHDEGFILCAGELRPNKGADLAIRASAQSGRHLIVAGAPIDMSYAQTLRTLSSTSPVTIIDRFLSASEFAWLLALSDAVLLPYREFDAQSGVLARAMELGRPIVISELRSLREQAGDYPIMEVHRVDDASDLASAMHRLLAEGRANAERCIDTRDAWYTFARLCLSESRTSAGY